MRCSPVTVSGLCAVLLAGACGTSAPPAVAPATHPNNDAASAPPDAATATVDATIAASGSADALAPIARPAMTAEQLRTALAAAANDEDKTAALAGRPGILALEVDKERRLTVRCVSASRGSPPADRSWTCDADLRRCRALQPERATVWTFHAGPSGARLLDAVVTAPDPALVPSDAAIEQAVAGRGPVCALHDALRAHDPGLAAPQIDAVTIQGASATRATLCGEDARGLEAAIIAQADGWSCTGPRCTPRDAVASPSLHVAALADASGAWKLATVALAVDGGDADATAKAVADALSAPPGTCATPPTPPAASVAAALDAYAKGTLAATLACYDGTRDAAARDVFAPDDVGAWGTWISSQVRVLRASDDEVLVTDFGTFRHDVDTPAHAKDTTPHLDTRDALVRKAPHGAWEIVRFSTSTGASCFSETAAAHKAVPWRPETCFDVARAAFAALAKGSEAERPEAQERALSAFVACLAP